MLLTTDHTFCVCQLNNLHVKQQYNPVKPYFYSSQPRLHSCQKLNMYEIITKSSHSITENFKLHDAAFRCQNKRTVVNSACKYCGAPLIVFLSLSFFFKFTFCSRKKKVNKKVHHKAVLKFKVPQNKSKQSLGES